MSDLSKYKTPLWGEDLHRELAKVRKIDESLAVELQETIKSKYRLWIRDRFQSDPKVASILTSTDKATSVVVNLALSLDDLRHPDSADIFDLVLEEIAQEYDKIKLSGGLLIDPKGRSLGSLKPEQIYQPPDYVGEDGLLHKARPIVHPGISSSLALRDQQEHKVTQALKLVERDKSLKETYEHLNGPETIRERALESLVSLGFNIDPIEQASETVTIEFGREQADGVFQSPNKRFHRTFYFATTLVKKIQSLAKNKCEIVSIVEKVTNKSRWYEAEVRLGADS